MHALLESDLSRLLAQIFAIVAVSRLVHAALRPMRQPLAVAEMIAGILLGPSLLGWLAPELSGALFPPSSVAVLHQIGQLGLVFFMFLVGLELDLDLLRGHRRSLSLISLGGIATPMLIGVAVGYLMYPVLSTPDVSRTAFSLFFGISLSITAFPVLARILKEQRLIGTEVGAIVIGSAAVGDVTAWSMLAFIVAITRADDVGGSLATLALTLAFVGVMLGVVRPLLARLARSMSQPGTVTQNLVTVAIMAVLASSWLTEAIGIHSLFGAFLLGAIVPREGGLARTFVSRIEDLVVLILLPVFIASTGLRVEIGLLSSGQEWAICGFVIAVACIGKIGGVGVSARLVGFPWRAAGAIGLLMNTRGLMELVVLTIGLELGILSRLTFSMMVLMAVVTTFMTVPFLHLFCRPHLLASASASAPHPGMRRPPR